MQAKLTAILIEALVVVLLLGSVTAWGWSWKSKYETLVAKDFEKTATAQRQRADDLDKKLTQLQSTLATNKRVMDDYAQQHENDAANLQHVNELVKRLLINAARPRPTSNPLPASSDRPSTPDPSAGQSDGDVGSLLADAAAECRHNALQLNALIAEIKPQLGSR